MKKEYNIETLRARVMQSKAQSVNLWNLLKTAEGIKYTVNHDTVSYPAAVLYGTWSAVHGKRLVLGDAAFNEGEKDFLSKSMLAHRLSDGAFLPQAIFSLKTSKSIEYLKLHCFNYATEAMLHTQKNYDFQSAFMDKFLEADFLQRWLEQRSLERPWEESNNIVNVASYLALCADNGNAKAKEALYQMLQWHNKVQNPKTGGFDNFGSPSQKQKAQSMAGAVHNFHLHLYLNEPWQYEHVIARNVEQLLFQGVLTACLSIDYVELACRVIDKATDRNALIAALLFHLKCLLEYQNPDGGWYENDSHRLPTSAAGMKEQVASSCSYATWFRLCSIGMIDITLLQGNTADWNFRKTLGMGYAPDRWNAIQWQTDDIPMQHVRFKNLKKNAPSYIKAKLIQTAAKILK